MNSYVSDSMSSTFVGNMLQNQQKDKNAKVQLQERQELLIEEKDENENAGTIPKDTQECNNKHNTNVATDVEYKEEKCTDESFIMMHNNEWISSKCSDSFKGYVGDKSAGITNRTCYEKNSLRHYETAKRATDSKRENTESKKNMAPANTTYCSTDQSYADVAKYGVRGK